MHFSHCGSVFVHIKWIFISSSQSTRNQYAHTVLYSNSNQRRGLFSMTFILLPSVEVQPHSNLWCRRDFNYVAQIKLVLLHRKFNFQSVQFMIIYLLQAVQQHRPISDHRTLVLQLKCEKKKIIPTELSPHYQFSRCSMDHCFQFCK